MEPVSPEETPDGAPLTRRVTVAAAAGGVALLALAAAVWPSGTLEQRTLDARVEAVSAQDQAAAAVQAAADAEAAESRAEAEEHEARAEAEQAADAAATLTSARDRVEQAERAVLVALATSFSAADDVVGAQNTAVDQGNRGNTSGERAVITTEAVPALEDYRDSLAAAESALAELRTAVVALQQELP